MLIWKHDGDCDFAPHEQGDVEFVKEQIVNTVAAPTAHEIADQLPTLYWVAKDDHRYSAGKEDPAVFADTMADALGLLWLRLRETSNAGA